MRQMSLDVVVPLYNDEEVIEELCKTVFTVLEEQFKSVRLILIDDGSHDDTYQTAKKMRKEFDKTEVIRLAGNYGQHRAILAGLRATKADIVAVMDSDLQDRPEHISIMVDRMLEEDTSMAIAKRIRRVDSRMKKITSSQLSFPYCSGPRVSILHSEMVQ